MVTGAELCKNGVDGADAIFRQPVDDLTDVLDEKVKLLLELYRVNTANHLPVVPLPGQKSHASGEVKRPPVLSESHLYGSGCRSR